MYYYLIRDGFIIDSVGTCYEAYKKLNSEIKYSIIISDLYFPLYDTDKLTYEELPKELKTCYKNKRDSGICIIEWILKKKREIIPIIVISVDIETHLSTLHGLGIKYILSMSSITPQRLHQTVRNIISEI